MPDAVPLEVVPDPDDGPPGARTVIVNPDDLSCKELVELVTSYLEDGLSPSERTRFEIHLGYCASCRVYLDQMRQTIQAAGHLSERTLPPGSKERLLSAFRDWKRNRGGTP